MAALETNDFGNQLDVLLERYEVISSPNVRTELEKCIASSLGCMERLVTKGDMGEEDYS